MHRNPPRRLPGMRPVGLPAPDALPDYDTLSRDWARGLQASGVSPATLRIYSRSAAYLGAYLAAQGMPLVVSAISAEHIEDWKISLQAAGREPTTVATYHRGVQQFFTWLVEQGELSVSPFAHLRQPQVPEPVTPVYEVDQLDRLLKTCRDGKDFYSRRDFAILSLLLDTGLRLHEAAGIGQSDLDLDHHRIHVRGKGATQRDVRIGVAATAALSQYARVRRLHPFAAHETFWLGRLAPLTAQGLYQAVRKRADQADLPDLHPHSLRHQFAHLFLLHGGQERDLEELGGWASGSKEARRYGRSAAAERARAAHSIHSPLDNLRPDKSKVRK